MEKYTALLMPAYLSGFVLAVLLIPILTFTSEVTDGFYNVYYFPTPVSLSLLLIAGALTGILTIFLARGINYLFIEQSP